MSFGLNPQNTIINKLLIDMCGTKDAKKCYRATRFGKEEREVRRIEEGQKRGEEKEREEEKRVTLNIISKVA